MAEENTTINPPELGTGSATPVAQVAAPAPAAVAPAPTPTPTAPATSGLNQSIDEDPLEAAEGPQKEVKESFFLKNKLLLIGAVVAVILVTVIVGVLLSLKNSDNMQGMINKVLQERESMINQGTSLPAVK